MDLNFNGTLVEFKAKKRKPTAQGSSAQPGSAAATAAPEITLRFLILDAPAPSTLGIYIKELQRNQVRHLVRVCTQTYRSDIVELAGIKTHAWPFEDGAPPPQTVISQWLALVDSEIDACTTGICPTIAIHCVAGLGRAPILVAVALVEYGGFQAMDAIGHIRERRKGAINQVQLQWLMQYKGRFEKKWPFDNCCVIQ